MMIQTNPGIRMRPPSKFNDNNWIIENYHTKKRITLSISGVYILIYFCKPQDLDVAIQALSPKLEITDFDLQDFINSLLEREVLIEKVSDETDLFREVNREWIERGWIEAFEYFFSTYNYQFIGADEVGRQVTNERMLKYSSIEFDIHRSKKYEKALDSITLNHPSMQMIPISASKIWSQSNLSKLDFDKLNSIITITFGKVKEINPKWNGAPLIQKTSPSGGARHPSEGYILVKNVSGLAPGLYHYHVDSPQLDLINTNISELNLQEIFPLLYSRATFNIGAIIIITSVFERNMYRYREPRTFRTIHMDAGHLCGTIEAVSSSLGIQSFVQYGGQDSEIEGFLGVNGLEEGYQLSIALGDY